MKKLTTKEDVFNLLSASTASIALGAAIETGLLDMLAENPKSGEEVSRQMNIPGKRGYYWLQLLTELGILEKESRGYVPSVLAHSAILDVKIFLGCGRSMVSLTSANGWPVCATRLYI